MRDNLELLANFSLDCWLLARAVHASQTSPVDGRAWERAIGDLLRLPDFPNRQRGGQSTLFGTPAASGVAHELDLCASGSGRTFLVECKSRASGAMKVDVFFLHEKSLDFYCAQPRRFSHERWWRILVSSTPVSQSVRAVCVSLGVVLIDPIHLPLSVILWTAARPGADMRLREPLLQDVVRLGERALLALQERWRYDTRSAEIRFKPSIIGAKEIQDLLWVQEELGSDILDLYYHYRSESIELREVRLLRTLRSSFE